MPTRKPSILILYCGGTIGMRQDTKTSALRPELTVDDLLRYAPALGTEFSVKTITITNLDSTNIQPHHWQEIAQAIAKRYDDFDGFVVLHGTDTMAYTASALSLALGDLGKPVILTGAQVPPDLIGSDATGNLVNACQAATMDFAEVAIVFGTMILRGNRSTKISESDRNAFASPVFPVLGAIRLQPELSYANVRRRHGGSLVLRHHFAGNIAVIKLVPGLDPAVLMAILEHGGIDGLILESFGPGNIPNKEMNLLPAIQQAKKQSIPILITSQCIAGTTRMYLYEVGQRALELGVIPTRDMTPESAYIKLKWVLGQTRKPREIIKLFDQDIAGEVTVGV